MSGTTEKEVVPAGSILGRFAESVAEEVEHHTKVLPLGVLPGLWVEYEALPDEEVDEIRATAKQRSKMRARVSRDGSADDPEGERQAYAQLLARACVQIMVATEDGYEPLHLAHNRETGGSLPPLRFNSDLMEALATVSDLPGGLTIESSATEIVRTLHRRGKSTAPLLTMGSLYDAWRSGVTQAVIADTIGE